MSSKKEKHSNPSQGSSSSGKQKQSNKSNNENPGGKGNTKKQNNKQQSNNSQRKGGVSQANEEDVKREQKLQAVLLADSFSQTFRPITYEKPKVLLPVVNIPMIDYTIEFLAQNGVEEIIVYCVWYANVIESYLAKSKWSSLISIRCVSSTTCTSAGDALRDLDKQNIVRSDPFILIAGDIISNMNLKKAIEFHKLKRKHDPNNIMTCVLKKIQRFTPSKPLLDDLIVGLNQNTDQILLFEDLLHRKDVSLSFDVLANNNTSEITFFTDLLDCNIDICSQELLLQFSDNFDYQDIRQDFIRNEATNFALGKHLYAYILHNEYAARIKDPHTYHAISRDIVTRWVYPFVPDIQLLEDASQISYVQSKRYVYKSQGVRISRTANIEEEVVIGKGTSIGHNTSITKSIIGKDNQIGSDTVIGNSHIWNNVLIEDNVSINSAIVCDGAIIREGAVIPRGCIVSYGVEIGRNTRIDEFTRITKWSDSINLVPLNNVEGGIWKPTADNPMASDPSKLTKDSDTIEIDLTQSLRMCSIGCYEEEAWRRDVWAIMQEPAEDDDDDDDEYDAEIYEDFRLQDEQNLITTRQESELPSADSEASDDENEDDSVFRDPDFCRNILELVITAVKEGHPVDSILLEIKGLKFAQNKSFGDCLQGVIQALFTIILEKSTLPQTILQLLKQLTKKDSFIYKIVHQLTQDLRNQIEIISFIEDYAIQSVYIQPIFRFVLQTFHNAGLEYDVDDNDDEEDENLRLLSTDAILSWADKRESLKESHPRSRFIRDAKVQEFIEWLRDEDEAEDVNEEEET